ncbi:MAG TPA: class I SAM-dependent methyltransferase [Vicinamibacterales bacterium]|nr:class I SAM-dependent methyltransferase [Vicinamibacterales bacterium]
MSADQGPSLLSRLLAERAEAHRRYNEALTEVDRAVQSVPGLPAAPPPYDESQLPRINDSWQIGDAAASPALLFEKQMAFNAAVVDHLNRNVAAHRETTLALERALPALQEAFAALARFESLLVQFLQTITPLADTHYRQIDDAIAQLKSVTDIAQRTAMVAKREVERVGRAGGEVTLTPAGPSSPGASAQFQYIGFEDRFRGSESEIRNRLKDFVPYFTGQSNVLDVGCGRGEFLQLLRDAGVSAKGIDLNSEMIEICRSRGFDAESRDAVGFLQTVPDESLGGLVAVQVIEHLDPGYLTAMLGLAFDKLRPGARIILETINPTCWVAFFESFIRDLSHVKPIHPETLQYLLQASGFSNVEIVYRAPTEPAGRLKKVRPLPEHFGDAAPDQLTELVSSFNSNVDRLNERMFSYQDFAAIATKP